MIITKEQLQYCGATRTKADLFSKLISKYSDEYGINNKMRMSHFLAQVIHESGCFFFLREIASGEKYEGRKDLGNTEKGDGKRFKGRGLIQLTGRYMYTKVSKAFGIDFINNPELLETPEYAVRSAMWYWESHGLNERADRDELTAITKIINGGLNGKEQRLKYLGKAKRALGVMKR